MKISTVYLYDEPSVPEIKLKELGEFIKNNFSFNVEIRESIFSFFKDANDQIAYDLAACRIFDPKRPFERHVPTSEEVVFEKESFFHSKETNIIMYDGFEFQKILTDIIPEEERHADRFHMVCTNKLTCTFDYDDYRYHGRAVICSNPAIISTTGMIEAPAKPREYYLNLLTNMIQGLNVDAIKNQFVGTHLQYHDPKLSEIIKGYAMQALFYYLTGEPFCESKECRLFNAHWQ
ncbi:MAG TPA: DUF6775 family putative metallopeptidase, partial [Nitrosopumilaceae archaeon]|nr:DUF6775 family putative metallopeptidase [Nitrosopumilaceae archaeon]